MVLANLNIYGKNSKILLQRFLSMIVKLKNKYEKNLKNNFLNLFLKRISILYQNFKNNSKFYSKIKKLKLKHHKYTLTFIYFYIFTK